MLDYLLFSFDNKKTSDNLIAENSISKTTTVEFRSIDKKI